MNKKTRINVSDIKLPSLLSNEINKLELTPAPQKASILFLYRIYQKYKYNQYKKELFYDIPMSYIKNNIDKNPKRWMNSISHLIEFTGYDKNKNECRSYRIKAEFLEGNLVEAYKEKKDKGIKYNSDIKNSVLLRKDIYTKNQLNRITIDVELARRKVLNNLAKVGTNLVLNEKISLELIPITTISINNKELYWRKKDDLISIAKLSRCDLIQDRGEYYIEKVQEYIRRKKMVKQDSLYSMIDKINNKSFSIVTNPTNLRQYSNLTNLLDIPVQSGPTIPEQNGPAFLLNVGQVFLGKVGQ